MRLVVGLGNPGPQYALTRHNAGFMLADALADASGIRLKKTTHAHWGEGLIAGVEVVIVKPQTYMNLSGSVVAEFKVRYDLSPPEMIAAYDDCDLPLGRIRLKKDGGSGGHRGVASIIECIGTTEFPRLRIGIGRPENPEIETKDFVLSSFSGEEFESLAEVLKRAVASVEVFLTHGIDRAMNSFNKTA